MLPGVEPAAAGAVDEDDRRAVPRGAYHPRSVSPSAVSYDTSSCGTANGSSIGSRGVCVM